MNPQRLIRRVTDPEHPFVSCRGAYADPDLIGQCLESKLMVGIGQTAGDSFVGSMRLLYLQQQFYRLFEPPFKQMFMSLIGDDPFGAN